MRTTQQPAAYLACQNEDCPDAAKHRTVDGIALCTECAKESDAEFATRCARCGEECEADFEGYWRETAYCSSRCQERDEGAFEGQDAMG